MASIDPLQSDLDKALRIAVGKSSNERLRNELSFQNFFDQEAIQEFTRDELIRYVVQLRKFAGNQTAVKQMMIDFIPHLTTTLTDTATETETLIPTVSTVSSPPSDTVPVLPATVPVLPVTVTPAADSNALMAMLMAQMAAAAENARADRLMMMERQMKLDEQAKIAAERQARIEETARAEKLERDEQAKIAVETARLEQARIVEQARAEKLERDEQAKIAAEQARLDRLEQMELARRNQEAIEERSNRMFETIAKAQIANENISRKQLERAEAAARLSQLDNSISQPTHVSYCECTPLLETHEMGSCLVPL
jgi:hypothetical protein